MIRNAPLSFVAQGADGLINRTFDEANACASASRGALSSKVNQLLRRGGAGLAGLALRGDFKVFGDLGLYAVPFFR
jgi:hypothetical protein